RTCRGREDPARRTRAPAGRREADPPPGRDPRTDRRTRRRARGAGGPQAGGQRGRRRGPQPLQPPPRGAAPRRPGGARPRGRGAPVQPHRGVGEDGEMSESQAPAGLRGVRPRRAHRSVVLFLLLLFFFLGATARAFDVRIVHPAPGESLIGEAEVRAEVVPAGTAIERVEFFLDGALAGTATQAPYRILLDAGEENRAHKLEVVAHAA